MKIAITADTHFANFTEFSKTVVEPVSGLPINSRLLDQLTNFWNMCVKAKSLGATYLIIAGDLFHIRGSVPTDVYQFVYSMLARVKRELGFDIAILIGNHDQMARSGEIHSVYGLRDLVEVIDQPLRHLIPGAVSIYFVPYVADKAKLQEALDFNTIPTNLLIAHCGIDGASIGPVEYKIKDPVTVDDLHPERYDWVLLGHYHKPQTLADNVRYIGSPAQINRGEVGEVKRWLMYDSDTPTFLKSYGTRAKQFKTIASSELLVLPVDKQHYYDVLMDSFTTELEVFDKAQQFSVKIIANKRDTTNKKRIVLAEDMTDEDILKAYVKHKQTPAPRTACSLGMDLLRRSDTTTTSNTRLAFLNIRVENFMAIGSIKLKLHKPGSVIAVMGDNQSLSGFTSNGAGKSSLLPEAIFWCLWGKTARDLPADKVVNNKTKRNCCVTLVLMANNNKLVVTRFRKHSTMGGDGLQLMINGKDCTEGIPRLTQARLDKELGVDFLTFSSVMAFSPDTLRFVSSTDVEQKYVLDSILQTRRFTAALALTKDALTSVKTSRLECAAAAERYKATLDQLTTLATQYRTVNAEWEYREKQRVADIKVAIEILEDDRDIAERSMDRAVTRCNELKEQLDIDISKIPDQQAIAANIGKNQTALGVVHGSIKVTQERLSSVQSMLDAAVNLAGKSCPTCGMKITNTGTLITNFQAERNKLTKKLKEYDLSITQLTEAAKLLREEEIKAARLELKATTTRQLLNQTTNGVVSLQYNIRKCTEEISKGLEQIEQRPVNDFAKLLEETENKIDTVTRDLTEQEMLVTKYDKTLVHLQFWQDGFGNSGIRSFLLDQILPDLTRYANEFSDALTGGSIQIGFQTFKEGASTDKFNIQAWNGEGSDIYRGDSSGEKRRVDICVMFALFRIAYNRTRFNILLLDEALDSMDEAGLENVVAMLEDLATKLKLTIYVTSHTNLNQRLHEYITIRKVNGIATIV